MVSTPLDSVSGLFEWFAICGMLEYRPDSTGDRACQQQRIFCSTVERIEGGAASSGASSGDTALSHWVAAWKSDLVRVAAFGLAPWGALFEAII